MVTRFYVYWESVRTSYWFVPGLMVALSTALAPATVELDRLALARIDRDSPWWIYTGGPEGARAVLATVAGSMITVAVTVFSITIVALSLASAQFGPRLLRNFIRDRSNQVVLGAFVSTFTYCLLVLRTVRERDGVQFVPGIGVAVGIALALVSLGVLIYFIHHVAVSIQADHVILSVSQELHEAIDRLWPAAASRGKNEAETDEQSLLPADFEERSVPIKAEACGYLAAIDDAGLLAVAAEQDLLIRALHRPGQFVVSGEALTRVLSPRPLDESNVDAIRGAFLIESQRTPFQDVEFAVDQLVEVAVRALSPGVNDPFTAIACVDRLGEALCRLAQRATPSPTCYDESNHLRVVLYPAAFGAVADAAFNQIRQYGRSSAAVMIRLLETLTVIADRAHRQHDLRALERHSQLVFEAANRGLPDEADRQDAAERYQAINQLLESKR